jgi:hypothetical protein
VIVAEYRIHPAQIARRVVPRSEGLEVRQPGFAAEIALAQHAMHARRHLQQVGAGHENRRPWRHVGGKHAAQLLDERAGVTL